MSQINRDTITEWQITAEEFVKDGGDVCLFWAGRMAVCIDLVLSSNLMSLSQNLELMSMTKNEYDKTIFDKMRDTR